MLTISQELQAHLDQGATTLCHCWLIRRRDAEVFGFTDHDRSISFDNVHFEPESGVNGAALTATADLAVDNSEIEGILNSDLLSTEDFVAGRFDEAEIFLWRVNWLNVEQRVLVKTGIIGEVSRYKNSFRAEIRGLSHFLDQTVGRLYQRHCDANVGDLRCGVDLNNPLFKTQGVVLNVVDEAGFVASGFGGFDQDWFTQGHLTWVTGGNKGASGFVKSQARDTGINNIDPDHHAITLWQPTPLPVKVGDRFEVMAGCDRRFETCRDKFSNTIRFRGFHLMPGNDFIISYPTRDEVNDGGRR